MEPTVPRPVRIDDLLHFVVPGSVQIAAGGERLIWVERSVDPERKITVSHLAGAAPGGDPRRLTSGGPRAESSPRLSPDGRRLAFVRRDVGEGRHPAELCLVAAEGGEARVLASVDGDLADPVWSPDGRHLIVAVRRADPVAEGDDAPLSIRVDRVFYKLDGVGYLPRDRFRLHRVEVDAREPALEPLCPAGGDWDDTAPAISPDGAQVAFLSQRRGDRGLDQDNLDLWVVALEGGEPRCCTRRQGPLMSPVWSPDGSWIAALGCFGPPGTGLLRANIGLLRIDPAGLEEEILLTEELDRSVMNLTIDDLWGLEEWAPRPGFSPEGDRVLVPIADRGRTWLGWVAADGGAVTPAVPEVMAAGESVASFATAGGWIATITTSPTEPGVVQRIGPDGQRERIAWPMATAIEPLSIASPRELVVESDGVAIQGWILLPVGDGPFPLLLDIHGGPVVQFGTGFFHEMQTYVAAGYAVLMVNPRGSQGYGIDFCRIIERDWASAPFTDLMAALDVAIDSFPIDRDRLGVLGGSYGGYMTNWIIGHSNRFRTACTQRTVAAMEPLMWSDFGWAWGAELGGWPWEQPEHYRQQSPITYAEQIETPLLILQGLADHRTPADQGERLFVTLKVLGKEVEMVLFPGAGHDLSRNGKPRQRIERLEVIHDWLARTL
jgi:dipeptidyl aminopeptidase/acylaminoacyl peptidase